VSSRKAARRRAWHARAAALLGLLVAVAGLAFAGAAGSTDGTDGTDPVGTGALVDPITTTIPEPTTTTATDGTTNNRTDGTGGRAAAQAADPDVVAQDTPPSGAGSIALTKITNPTFGAGTFTFTLAWSGATCNAGVPGSTQVTLTTPPSGQTHTFTNLQTTGCTWTLTEAVPAGWVVGPVTCSGGVSSSPRTPTPRATRAPSR
jgi:hypothetical protein